MRTIPTIGVYASLGAALFLMACAHNPPATSETPQYPLFESDTAVVTMGPAPVSGRKVVVFQTQLARVVVDYADFVKNLDSTIFHYKNDYDAQLKQWISARTMGVDSIMLHHLSTTDKLRERALYRLADLLQSGKGAVYDRGSGTLHTEIIVETYADRWAKLAGRGGRRFMLPDRRVFLAVLDWISGGS